MVLRNEVHCLAMLGFRSLLRQRGLSCEGSAAEVVLGVP